MIPEKSTDSVPTKTAICCVGHITLDKVITPKFSAYMPGGTAYYFAEALRNLDHKDFRLVTAVGQSELPVVDKMRGEGLDIIALPSERSVFFENKYGEDMNNRTQRVLAKADPFTIKSLEGIEADVFHLGTLLADDFDVDVIKDLSARGKVSVDVQGYLRKVEGENVVHTDFAEKKDIMPYIDILKANEKEMEVLTGESDPYKAAKILNEWGCKEVLLTLGDKGSLIYADGQFFEIPAIPASNLVDATGCGDTYMAGYLYMREKGASYKQAGTFAAAMCTIKLGDKGPFSATEKDILELISKNDGTNL